MHLVVPKETRSGEKRVAAAPATIAKLIKLGFEVTIESDAGLTALFTNENYQEAGAKVTTDISNAIKSADVVASVGTLPANIATVDDTANNVYGNVWSKQQSDALYMIADQFVSNGKIMASKIEALGLTELISVTETSLAAFMANNANYQYEKNDMIAIPDGAGNYSLYIYKGGTKTTAGNYIPTGLTNITIAMATKTTATSTPSSLMP